MRASWVSLGVSALIGVGVLGCEKKLRPEAPEVRFTHADHLLGDVQLKIDGAERALACTDCHRLSVDTQWVTRRPGADQHAPCDACHQDAFRAPPGEFCRVCHAEVDPLRAGGSKLAPYRPLAARAELVGRFGHAVHLGSTVRLGGRELACEDCHRVESEESAFASFPIHADCAQCHAPGEQAAKHVTMQQCAGCHRASGPGRLRNFARNDVRFTHGKHQRDQAGRPISCDRCHSAIVESPEGDALLPGMETCETCHEDPDRTPDRVRIENCGVCHITDVRSRPLPGNHTASRAPGADGHLGSWPTIERGRPVATVAQALEPSDGTMSDALPSLSDLLPSPFEPYVQRRDGPRPPEAVPAEDRRPVARRRESIERFKSPDDHTPMFRTRHGDAAAQPEARCGYCHGEVSGARDGCQDCHAVMRPVSHTLHFRNASHGREAARDPMACATCHEVDYCTACHAVPPPSHRGNFATRHQRVAAFNPRACLTCHSFEGTCIECHVSNSPRPGIDRMGLRRGGRR